jgi:hydrogenase maturation protein HypF
MVDRGINTVQTSSCGRLFDAVAALLGLREEITYEAQAAIELEGVAVDEPYELRPEHAYEIDLVGGDWAQHEPILMSTRPLWSAILEDLRSGVSKAAISARFHAGVAFGFVKAATRARGATGIAQVVLSGGCMHNRRLVRLLRQGLEAEGFEVFQHRRVSPGDGGLSYGQAAVGAATLSRRSEGAGEISASIHP